MISTALKPESLEVGRTADDVAEGEERLPSPISRDLTTTTSGHPCEVGVGAVTPQVRLDAIMLGKGRVRFRLMRKGVEQTRLHS